MGFRRECEYEGVDNGEIFRAMFDVPIVRKGKADDSYHPIRLR